MTGLQSGKLVRFLGMVQDTSFSQEIYVGMTKSRDVSSSLVELTDRNGNVIDTGI
jgi:hypothetical protein